MIYVVGPRHKTPTDALVINTTSRSSNWSAGLSPFFLGPVNLYSGYVSKNVENAWQYSKVYEYYLEEDGSIGERYFQWAKDGWDNVRAVRYPMGKDANKPLYSYWEGVTLSYIEARKKIYIPLYFGAVKQTKAFEKLQSIYKENPNIYLWDFDAHNLVPGTFDYWELWNNDQIKVGHAYVLAMMLEQLI